MKSRNKKTSTSKSSAAAAAASSTTSSSDSKAAASTASGILENLSNGSPASSDELDGDVKEMSSGSIAKSSGGGPGPASSSPKASTNTSSDTSSKFQATGPSAPSEPLTSQKPKEEPRSHLANPSGSTAAAGATHTNSNPANTASSQLQGGGTGPPVPATTGPPVSGSHTQSPTPEPEPPFIPNGKVVRIDTQKELQLTEFLSNPDQFYSPAVAPALCRAPLNPTSKSIARLPLCDARILSQGRFNINGDPTQPVLGPKGYSGATVYPIFVEFPQKIGHEALAAAAPPRRPAAVKFFDSNLFYLEEVEKINVMVASGVDFNAGDSGLVSVLGFCPNRTCEHKRELGCVIFELMDGKDMTSSFLQEKDRRKINPNGSLPGAAPVAAARLRAPPGAQLQQPVQVKQLTIPFREGPHGNLVQRQVPIEVHKVPHNTVIHWLLDIARGLHTLHSNNLVHNDVKPANAFCTEHSGPRGVPSCKLGDYGSVLPREEKSTVTGLVGSPFFTDPNSVGIDRVLHPTTWSSNLMGWIERPFSAASDMYAFGVTIFFFIFGTHPAEESPQTGITPGFWLRTTPEARLWAVEQLNMGAGYIALARLANDCYPPFGWQTTVAGGEAIQRLGEILEGRDVGQGNYDIGGKWIEYRGEKPKFNKDVEYLRLNKEMRLQSVPAPAMHLAEADWREKDGIIETQWAFLEKGGPK